MRRSEPLFVASAVIVRVLGNVRLRRTSPSVGDLAAGRRSSGSRAPPSRFEVKTRDHHVIHLVSSRAGGRSQEAPDSVGAARRTRPSSFRLFRVSIRRDGQLRGPGVDVVAECSPRPWRARVRARQAWRSDETKEARNGWTRVVLLPQRGVKPAQLAGALSDRLGLRLVLAHVVDYYHMRQHQSQPQPVAQRAGELASSAPL